MMIQPLSKTGMVLGVTEDGSWELREIHLTQSDTLLLYTDGIIDAQDITGAPFGEERLQETVMADSGLSAEDFQVVLLRDLHGFMGDAPQADDITLIVIVREA